MCSPTRVLRTFLLACTVLDVALCDAMPKREAAVVIELEASPVDKVFTEYYLPGDILVAGISPIAPWNPLVPAGARNDYFAIRTLAWLYAVERANKEILLPGANFSLGIAVFNVLQNDIYLVGDVTNFMATRSVNFCWLWDTKTCSNELRLCELKADLRGERVPVFLNPGYTSEESRMLERLAPYSYCSELIGNRFGTTSAPQAASLEAVALCDLFEKLGYSNVIVALVDDNDQYTKTIARGLTIANADFTHPEMFCPRACMTVYWYNISVVDELCRFYDRCVLVVLASQNGALKFFSTFMKNHDRIPNLQIVAGSGWAGQQYALKGFERFGENTIGIVPRLTKNEAFLTYLQTRTLDDVRGCRVFEQMIADQNNCSLVMGECKGTERLLSIDSVGFGVAQHDIDNVIEFARAVLRAEERKCANESASPGEKFCDSFRFLLEEDADVHMIKDYRSSLLELGFGELSLVQYQRIGDEEYAWAEIGTYTNETDGWRVNETLFRSDAPGDMDGKVGWIIGVRERNVDPTAPRCIMSVFTFSWFTSAAGWICLVFGVLLTLFSAFADVIIGLHRKTPVVRFAFPGYAMTLLPSVSLFILTGFFISIASLESAGCITVSTLLSLLIANVLATMNAKLLLFQRHMSLHKTLDCADSSLWSRVNVFYPFSFYWIVAPMLGAVALSIISTVVLAASTVDKMKFVDDFFVTIRQTHAECCDVSTICVSLADKLAILADVPTYALLAAIFVNATRARHIQFTFMLNELKRICVTAAAIVLFQLMTTAAQFSWSTVEGVVIARAMNVFLTSFAVICLIKLPIVYLLLFKKEKNTAAYVKEVATRRTSRGLGGVFVIQRLDKFDRDESK